MSQRDWLKSKESLQDKVLSGRFKAQENSQLISQILTTISNNQSDINSKLGIGVANKRWINCILSGAVTFADVTVQNSVDNVGANNMILTYDIPLEYFLDPASGHGIVLTSLKIGLDDADANDYIDTTSLFFWSDHDSGGNLAQDVTDLNTIATHTWDFADQTIGVNNRVAIRLNCQNNGATQLSISWVKIEYYYL